MQTLPEFIDRHAIAMSVAPATTNPNTADDAWAATAFHWTCTLKRGRARLKVPFSQGSALAAPTTRDVLGCLMSDASGSDQDFEDWAGDYGYDTDSRKAERTWLTIRRQSRRLRAFLGDAAYLDLLENTEAE